MYPFGTSKRYTVRILAALLLILSLLLTSCGAPDRGGNSGLPDTGGIDGAPGSHIIRTASATLSTDTFDAFTTSLKKKIAAAGGYTESESLSSYRDDTRSLSVVIRIPAERFDSFCTSLATLGTISGFTSQVEDVSLTYATLAARVETLTQELSALTDLYARAAESGTVSDLIAVETRMTEVRTEIAEAKAALDVYDNRIAYSTLTLTVYEEEAPAVQKGFFARIGGNLANGFCNVGRGIVECLIFLVSALPYLLPFVAIAGIILLIYMLRHKNRKS